MTDFIALLSETDVSIVALYARWKVKGHVDSYIALSFAKAFASRGLLHFCSHCIARAIQDAKADIDIIAIAEFVRDEQKIPETALRILEQGREEYPNSANLWEVIADSHRLANSDWRDVIESYQSFKNRAFHSSVENIGIAWASFGWLLSEIDNYQLAEEAYRSALAVDPNYVWAINRLSGLLRRRFSRFKEAEELMLISIKLDPENAWSWYHIGFIYHHNLHNTTEALKAYRKSVEIDPNYTKVWECIAVLLAWETNDRVGAEEAFDKAFGMGDASAYAFNHYGVFLRENSDRYAEAESAIQTAIALEPEVWSHRLALAVLYEKRFLRFTDARRLLLEAKDRGAPVDDIDYRLAILVQRHRRSIAVLRN